MDDSEAKEARRLLLKLLKLVGEIEECSGCFAPSASLYDDHKEDWNYLLEKIERHLKKYSRAQEPN